MYSTSLCNKRNKSTHSKIRTRDYSDNSAVLLPNGLQNHPHWDQHFQVHIWLLRLLFHSSVQTNVVGDVFIAIHFPGCNCPMEQKMYSQLVDCLLMVLFFFLVWVVCLLFVLYFLLVLLVCLLVGLDCLLVVLDCLLVGLDRICEKLDTFLPDSNPVEAWIHLSKHFLAN